NGALNTFLTQNGSNIFHSEAFSSAQNPNFKTPTKYAFNFGIQRELPMKLTMMIGYVGFVARHQGRTYAFQDFFPTTIEQPGQVPSINGVPIQNPQFRVSSTGVVTFNGTYETAKINPACDTVGALGCYYWAGAMAYNESSPGVINLNSPNVQ